MPHVITYDPTGEIHGLPTFPWGAAPAGMATRRQLAEKGLRKNKQDPAAQLLRPRRRRPPLVAYLYRVDLAAKKRPMTPAKYAAVLAAVRARRVCQGPCGRRDLDYIAPDCNGRRCFDCEAAAQAKGGDR